MFPCVRGRFIVHSHQKLIGKTVGVRRPGFDVECGKVPLGDLKVLWVDFASRRSWPLLVSWYVRIVFFGFLAPVRLRRLHLLSGNLRRTRSVHRRWVRLISSAKSLSDEVQRHSGARNAQQLQPIRLVKGGSGEASEPE